MIKIFTLNENGKIEITKEELEKLLDDSYWDGYYASQWHSPPPSYLPTITCSNMTINAEDNKNNV